MANIPIGQHASHNYSQAVKIEQDTTSGVSSIHIQEKVHTFTKNDSGAIFFVHANGTYDYFLEMPKLSEITAGWHIKVYVGQGAVAAKNVRIVANGGGYSGAATGDSDTMATIEISGGTVTSGAEHLPGADGITFTASNAKSPCSAEFYTDGSKWYVLILGQTAASMVAFNN